MIPRSFPLCQKSFRRSIWILMWKISAGQYPCCDYGPLPKEGEFKIPRWVSRLLFSETWRVRVKIFEDLDWFKANSFSMIFESWKNQLLKTINVSFLSTNCRPEVSSSFCILVHMSFTISKDRRAWEYRLGNLRKSSHGACVCIWRELMEYKYWSLVPKSHPKTRPVLICDFKVLFG